MIQAARSGKQSILEGSQGSAFIEKDGDQTHKRGVSEFGRTAGGLS
jgi:hypothetical protein